MTLFFRKNIMKITENQAVQSGKHTLFLQIKKKEVHIMRKNLQKAVGTHFGKPIWLISMIKPPKATKH